MDVESKVIESFGHVYDEEEYEEELEGQESIYGQYQFLLEDYKIIEGTDTDKTELKEKLTSSNSKEKRSSNRKTKNNHKKENNEKADRNLLSFLKLNTN